MLWNFVLYDGPSGDQYDFFGVKFPMSFHKWMKWHEEAVEQKNQQKKKHRLEYLKSNYNIMIGSSYHCSINFQVESTMEGYIVKFVVKNYKSFSKEKVEFNKGALARLVCEIPLRINILLVEEDIW